MAKPRTTPEGEGHGSIDVPREQNLVSVIIKNIIHIQGGKGLEHRNGYELFVVDEAQHHACKLRRTEEGGLLVEFKMKSKDKKIPSYISVDAPAVVIQIMSAMDKKERSRVFKRWGEL